MMSVYITMDAKAVSTFRLRLMSFPQSWMEDFIGGSTVRMMVRIRRDHYRAIGILCKQLDRDSTIREVNDGE